MKGRRSISSVIVLAFGALSLIAVSKSLQAEELVLRGGSCFPEGAFLSRNFEAFVQDVNQAGKGKVRIDYVGGAPAIGSPFELVNRTARGVFDIVGCTGSYYQNVLPEAEALKLIERTPEEIRQNGSMAYLNELHESKNLHVIARLVDDWPFYLFLNEKVDGANLRDLHLRSIPIYTPFFQSLGATTQASNIAEIYTLMENGTVDGFGWPVVGFLPDWYKVTKYRVEPGFYEADIHLLINNEKWRDLPEDARAFLQDVALKHERAATEQGKADVEKAKARQAEQGIEPIVLEGADRERWVSTAREIGWKSVIERSPANGPSLRKRLSAE